MQGLSSWWRAASFGLGWLLVSCLGVCEHEDIELEGNITTLADGEVVSHEVGQNKTRLYYYENMNVTTMNQPARYRKLIFSLEPCEGVVYLFVRMAKRCWPNPHSCCTSYENPSAGTKAPPCHKKYFSTDCNWTHFRSVIDGTQDGAPTFFEVPLHSTQYFISVYAPRELNADHGVTTAQYRLMALADIGAYPRPGAHGQLTSRQLTDMAVEVAWSQATFIPVGVSSLKQYFLYSSLMLPKESKDSESVFLSPSKIMNSVCGLEKNAVKFGMPLTNAHCDETGQCKAVISGLLSNRRYVLNILAESHRSFYSTYGGIIVSSEWTESTQLIDDRSLTLIGAILGSIFGALGIGYLWIVKLYN